MVFRQNSNPNIIDSNALTRKSGHIPHALNPMTARLNGMIAPTSGNEIRFVSRKYWGNVPKYIHARGPVVIWHAIDIDAEFHIHFSPFRTAPAFVSGQRFLRNGYMYAMPAIAAYESWSPMSPADSGMKKSCRINEVQSMLRVLLNRPVSDAVSPRMMNRKALVMEALAPVAIV